MSKNQHERCRRTWVAAALLGLSALASCVGPQIHQGQLSLLDKGITPQESVVRLKLAPQSSHRVAVGARSFEFQRYRLNNGVQHDLYWLAFERDKLAYWGYVSEFRRQPDAELNTALSQALREIGSER